MIVSTSRGWKKRGAKTVPVLRQAAAHNSFLRVSLLFAVQLVQRSEAA